MFLYFLMFRKSWGFFVHFKTFGMLFYKLEYLEQNNYGLQLPNLKACVFLNTCHPEIFSLALCPICDHHVLSQSYNVCQGHTHDGEIYKYIARKVNCLKFDFCIEDKSISMSD